MAVSYLEPAIPGSLLPRLSLVEQQSYEFYFRGFSRYVQHYASSDVVELAVETEQKHGHAAALAGVARYTGGDASEPDAWRRDRVAALAYRRLGEADLAARHLASSLREHWCAMGSCRFASGALTLLFLEAGRPLHAVLAQRLEPPKGNQFEKPLLALVSATQRRHLLHELVAAHRDPHPDVA